MQTCLTHPFFSVFGFPKKFYQANGPGWAIFSASIVFALLLSIPYSFPILGMHIFTLFIFSGLAMAYLSLRNDLKKGLLKSLDKSIYYYIHVAAPLVVFSFSFLNIAFWGLDGKVNYSIIQHNLVAIGVSIIYPVAIIGGDILLKVKDFFASVKSLEYNYTFLHSTLSQMGGFLTMSLAQTHASLNKSLATLENSLNLAAIVSNNSISDLTNSIEEASKATNNSFSKIEESLATASSEANSSFSKLEASLITNSRTSNNSLDALKNLRNNLNESFLVLNTSVNDTFRQLQKAFVVVGGLSFPYTEKQLDQFQKQEINLKARYWTPSEFCAYFEIMEIPIKRPGDFARAHYIKRENNTSGARYNAIDAQRAAMYRWYPSLVASDK